MQTVSEVMTRNARVVSPGESLQHAAQLMGELDVGALPVCDGERLVGMVTDRDIAVRGVAAGKSPESAHVDEVMTAEVRWCFEDQPLDEVMKQMADSQVRRIPVVSHDDQHKLVGIVSLGDVAFMVPPEQEQKVGEVLERVSEPAGARSPGPGAEQTAGPGAAQTAGPGAAQTAGPGAPQAAGPGGEQTAGPGAPQSAGPGATQTAGPGASQDAGAGSAQSAGSGSSQQVAGASGQPRINPDSEPASTAGGTDPSQASAYGKEGSDSDLPGKGNNTV